MKKAFKKSISLLLAAAMILPTSTVVFGALTPTGNNKSAFQDFSGGTGTTSDDIYAAGGAIAESGYVYGKDWNGASPKEGPVIQLSYNTNTLYQTNPDIYYIGYDITLMRQTTVVARAFGKGSSDGMAWFMFANNGLIYFQDTNTGNRPTANTVVSEGPAYEAGVPVKLGLVVNRTTGMVDYYVDDVFVKSASLNPTVTSMQVSSFQFLQEAISGEPQELIRVDNASFTVFTDNSLFGTLSYDNEKIEIDFSEPLKAKSTEGVAVTNTETGANVEIGEVSFAGNTLVINCPAGGLASATEYSVKLPDGIKSISGYGPCSDRVYFMSPTTGGGVDVNIFEDAFGGYAEDSENPDFNVPAGWVAREQRTIVENIIGQNLYDNASYTGDGEANYTGVSTYSAGTMTNLATALPAAATAGHTWAAKPGHNKAIYSEMKGNDTTVLGTATKYFYEFDYYMTGGNNDSDEWNISPRFINGPDSYSQYWFDGTGIHVKKDGGVYATLNTSQGITGTVGTSITAGLDEWHTVRLEGDIEELTIKMYVDSNLLLTINVPENSANNAKHKYIKGFRTASGQAASLSLYIDNIKFGKLDYGDHLNKVKPMTGVSDSAVQFNSSSAAPGVLTKNFADTISTDMTLNFDVKPVSLNNGADNLYVYLPADAAPNVSGTEVEETGSGSPYLMSINGSKLKLKGGTAELAVSADSWYNVSLTFNQESDKISAKAKANADSEWTDLGEVDYPAGFTGVMKRVSFTIPKADTGATMVLDNVSTSYKAPAFKVEKLRFYDVYGGDFGPLQTMPTTIKTAKVYFSTVIAGTESEIADAVKANITFTNGNVTEAIDTVSYDSDTKVATVEFTKFLKADKVYTVTIPESTGIMSTAGIELSGYTTKAVISNDVKYKDSVIETKNESGDVVSGTLTGANTLYATGEVLNTSDDAMELDITVAAYKTGTDSKEMIAMNETTNLAVDREYIAYGKGETELSISVNDAEYEAKTFTVNLSRYTAKESPDTKAGKTAEGIIYAQTPAKKGEKVYVIIRDGGNVAVYKDFAIAGEGGVCRFDIAVPATTDEYTAAFYNDGDKTKRVDTFAYASQSDLTTAVGAVNADIANPGKTDVDVAATITSNSTELGLDSATAGAMDAEQAVVLLRDWNSKPGNALTASNATEVLNQLAAITAVMRGTTNNLFEDYSDELKLASSRIGSVYNKEFVTEAIEEATTEAVSDIAQGIARAAAYTINTVDDFYSTLYEQFVLAVVKNTDGYQDVKDVTAPFKSEIGIATATLVDDAYSSVVGGDYASYTALGNALKAYTPTVGGGTGGGGGGAGGGGGSTGGSNTNVSDTVIGTGALTGEAAENTGNSTNINIFTDIEDVIWAQSAIVYLAEQGIIAGKGAKKFAPNDNVLREELAKILVGAFIKDAEEASITFGDVVATAWYAPFIRKAFGAGIINGYNANTFGIGDNITREDMAVMVYNSAKKAGMAFEEKEFELFSDDEQISDYAKEAVYTLRNEGVINGIDLSNFAPKASATRAEAAKIIYSLLKF